MPKNTKIIEREKFGSLTMYKTTKNKTYEIERGKIGLHGKDTFARLGKQNNSDVPGRNIGNGRNHGIQYDMKTIKIGLIILNQSSILLEIKYSS